MARTKSTPPTPGSMVGQMRAFIANHRGTTYTATALAKALGWTRRRTRRVTGEDGKAADGVQVSHNAKAAARLARRCGADVGHKRGAVGLFSITL